MSAAESQIHEEISLPSEPVFHIGSFAVTNSLLNSWLAVLIIVVLAFFIRKSIKKVPKGLQNAVEMVVDGALNLCDSVTNSRKKSLKVFPIVFSLFVFILINNWLGLLPGVGSIGYVEGGTFIPYLRGGTADMNTTLALALFAVVGANIFGIVSVGIWKYFNKFVNLKSFIEIPGKIKTDKSILLVNPIKFFVGLIEIVSEIAKIASLSFRLFGNIFAGEVLLSSIAVIFAYLLPLPFIFLEIIVGIIQALIFSMLTLVYFSVASTDEAH